MPNKKGKMPPQLLEYFKNKNKKKEGVDKAREAKNKKDDKKDK